MIEDPTKTEMNLFQALKQLSDIFNNDAGCLPMGIQVLLRSHKVGSYTPKIAKVLKSRNLIKYDPKGTRKNPFIYWNGDRPNLELCRSIMNEVREGNRVQWAKDHPRTEAEEKQIEKLLEYPMNENEAITSKGFTINKGALCDQEPVKEETNFELVQRAIKEHDDDQEKQAENFRLACEHDGIRNKAKEQLILDLKEDAVEKLYQAEMAIIEAKAILKYITNKIELLNDGII